MLLVPLDARLAVGLGVREAVHGTGVTTEHTVKVGALLVTASLRNIIRTERQSSVGCEKECRCEVEHADEGDAIDVSDLVYGVALRALGLEDLGTLGGIAGGDLGCRGRQQAQRRGVRE